MQSSLVSSFFDGEYLSSPVCKCGSAEPLSRCLDCCEWEVLCLTCLEERHRYPHLHKFEAWKEHVFCPFEMETPVWRIGNHNCSTSYTKIMTVVDEKGRQHKRTIEFCCCVEEAATLVRFHLWPSTVKKPTLAFHFELMKWLNGLFIEGHMSVKAFCEALKARASKHDRPYVTQEVSDIYKALMTECFEEFRSFIYSVEHPYYEDGTSCPACFKSSRKVISLDADFQLVRKRSAGGEWGHPKHTGHFFLNQKEVDDFISGYNSDKGKPSQDCSDFQAGSNLRSKSKFYKLDETALFGSTCQHGHPKYFFSLKHGERLGYSVYLIKKLLLELDGDQHIHIMYDIACSLKNHLSKHEDRDILDKIILSIPIFHCYGHKVSCQVLFNPRKTVGLGLIDGESCERLWSYLGQFSNITKESTTENRIDRLADCLIHFSRKLKDGLGTTLPEKIEKAMSLEVMSTKSLEELLQPFPMVKEENLIAWVKEEAKACSETPQRKRTLTDKDEQRREVLKTVHSLVSERSFLLSLMKKYARGQAVANRLSKQIKSVNKKVNNNITKYNAVGGVAYNLPETITFSDIKDISSDIWLTTELTLSEECNSTIPIRQEACQLFNLIQRCKEEVIFVKEEMLSTVEYYKSHLLLLYDSCLTGVFEHGKKSYAIKEGLFLELKIADLCSKFSTYIDSETIMPFTNQYQITSQTRPFKFISVGDEDDSEDDSENVC